MQSANNQSLHLAKQINWHDDSNETFHMFEVKHVLKVQAIAHAVKQLEDKTERES